MNKKQTFKLINELSRVQYKNRLSSETTLYALLMWKNLSDVNMKEQENHNSLNLIHFFVLFYIAGSN